MDQRMTALENLVTRLAASMDEMHRMMAAQQRVPEDEAGAADQSRPEGAGSAQPQVQTFSPLIDTRMLTKPKNFSGRDEDWASWAVVTRAYCGVLDPRFLAEMSEVEDTDMEVASDKLGGDSETNELHAVLRPRDAHGRPGAEHAIQLYPQDTGTRCGAAS